MNTKSFSTKSFLLVLSIAFMGYMYGQPADERLNDGQVVSKYNSGTAEIQPQDKYKIEQEYLAKARQNIEQFRKGDASFSFIDSKGKPVKNVQVEINQVTQDFLFGNIGWELTGFGERESYKLDLFKERFKALFNFAILPFYWSYYEEIPGQPGWQRNEPAIKWCLDNGITLKGHPLSWSSVSGTPEWIYTVPPDVATDLLKARIYENVVGYKGRINIWDVVNEAANMVSWETALRDTAIEDGPRYYLGETTIADQAGWVEKAFKWANHANPDGTYILNEFYTLARHDVRDRFYQLVKELLSRGTPIKGLGIQAHEPREEWFSPIEMYTTFDMYKEFNLPIHITEFMPQSGGKAITGWREGTWTEETQAEFAEQFYTLAFGYPSVVSINWWGLSDRNIWLPGGGLIDEEYNPKPVYNRLMKLIKEDWMTKNLILASDKKGLVNFRGFYGKYQVKITKPDGSIQVMDVHLKEKGENKWEVRL
jgi:GH35 family endo-1,4-beta-xylanase